MAIRADSYASEAEVRALTRHLLDGQSAFNSTTRPTVTEVEKFIDRSSGILNLALEKHGLASPVTNTTAKLACDDWVTQMAAKYVELTQRGTGYSGEEGSRLGFFPNLWKRADEFVVENSLGFKRLGVSVQNRASQGLTFTGLAARKDRLDPDDDTLAQPSFRRGQFDDPTQADDTEIEET